MASPIALNVDLDGTWFEGPVPFTTFFRLLTRRWSPPDEGRELLEYIAPTRWDKRFFASQARRHHAGRVPRVDAPEALKIFKQAAKERHRELVTRVLSGRELDKHELTKRALEDFGHAGHFVELLLNEGKRAVVWKEGQNQKQLEAGYTVVDLEDDFTAAWCEARLDPSKKGKMKLLVYLMKTAANSDWLLRWNGIDLPRNIVPVNSLTHAAHDFRARLATHQI